MQDNTSNKAKEQRMTLLYRLSLEQVKKRKKTEAIRCFHGAEVPLIYDTNLHFLHFYHYAIRNTQYAIRKAYENTIATTTDHHSGER